MDRRRDEGQSRCRQMVQGPDHERLHGVFAVLVSEHPTELARDDNARQALLDLSAHAVSRQLTAALALQARIRRLF